MHTIKGVKKNNFDVDFWRKKHKVGAKKEKKPKPNPKEFRYPE